MKFRCASNAAIKNVKIARKNNNFFSKYFQQNRHLKKNTDFLENIRLFSDSGGSSRHFDYLFTCLGLIIKL